MTSAPNYLANFERRSAPVMWSADLLRVADVPKSCIAPLLAAAHAEGDIRKEIAKARAAGLLRDPTLARFFDLWVLEEDEHAKAFAFLADSHGWHELDLTNRHSPTDRLRYRLAPIGLRLSALAPGTAQVFLAIGAAAESVTRTLYRSMARVATDEALSDLLMRIARQEARHQAFFVAAARDQPAPSPRQRAAIRALLVRGWHPVGMDRLGRATWLQVFGPFIAEPQVRDEMAMMDRVLDSVPALEGLDLMARFLESSAHHLAEP